MSLLYRQELSLFEFKFKWKKKIVWSLTKLYFRIRVFLIMFGNDIYGRHVYVFEV